MSLKNLSEIAIIVQARLSSVRVPRKMLKPFAGTTLLDILFKKLTTSLAIPRSNIIFSAHEPQLQEVGLKWGVEIFPRSSESAAEETNLGRMLEWHNRIPYKYVVCISATAPLLKQETIERFIQEYISTEVRTLYGVFEKKTLYWDNEGRQLNEPPGLIETVNTKLIDPIYEAGHCISASQLDCGFSKGLYLDELWPQKINPFVISPVESFDIDEQWQFDLAEAMFQLSPPDPAA